VPGSGGQDTLPPPNLGGGGMGGALGVPVGSGGSPNASGGSGPIDGSGGTPSWTVEDDCERPVGATGAFSRAALRDAAATCAEYHYCRFEAVSHELADQVEAYVDEPTASAQQIVREVLSLAFERWALIEAMQFGPVASATATAGRDIYQGQGLRSFIYPWPQVSRCRVDEQVASQKYQTLGMANVQISARGLPALETLQFYEGADTECAQNSTTYDLWSQLDAATLAEHKRAYAEVLAGDVLAQSQTLVDRWSPSGDDFHAAFVSASGYPDEQEAMNVLGWALLYIELEVKDWKLGVPAGYTVGAPVSGPETPFAGQQTALLRANLEGFRRIFQGCGEDYAGIGFDDWLVDAGHPDLAVDIIAASEHAASGLGSLPRFSTATTAEIQGAYAAVKVLTDLLKADLFGTGSVLNLKLPASLEGDTD